MRSSQLPLEQYDSDKIANRYLDRYDPILEPWLDKKIVLLELGVHKGGSLILWRDYFPFGTIVGIGRANGTASGWGWTGWRWGGCDGCRWQRGNGGVGR